MKTSRQFVYMYEIEGEFHWEVIIIIGLGLVRKVIAVEAEGTIPNFGGKFDDEKRVEYGPKITAT